MIPDLAPARLKYLSNAIRVEVEAAEADYQSAVQHAIRAGELLIEAKAQVDHGEWLPWLDANCPLSERHARNYMRLARNRQRVADLPSIREAVAELAEPRPNTDDAFVGLLIALAQDPAVCAEMVRRGNLGNFPMIDADGIRRCVAAIRDGNQEAIPSPELWDLADLCDIAAERMRDERARRQHPDQSSREDS